MIHVHAPSRLHFGLLHVPAREDGSGRTFGSVGLMLREPGLHLEAAAATDWSAAGPSSGRALDFARTFLTAVGSDRRCALIVHQAPLEHVGLGSGTQLALAVARGLVEALALPGGTAAELAPKIGRGLRSGIGIHGFDQGGFLVDGGKKPGPTPTPLLVRRPWPEDWQVALYLPERQQGRHGTAEREAFRTLAAGEGDRRRTDSLCRLVLLDLLPALVEENLQDFGEALYEFNRGVGEVFAPVQGGVYADACTTRLIEELRGRGIRGVGQSSWGPTVFAIVQREEIDRLCAPPAGRIRIATTGCNGGAVVGPA